MWTGRKWTVRSHKDSEILETGDLAKIVAVSGVKLIVEKYEDGNIMNSIIGIGTILFLIILVIVVLILISCVKIVHQAQAVVVERLGAYLTTWNTGLHFKLPIIDRVARRIDLKEQVVDFPPQPVITKDNVTSADRHCHLLFYH